ncbi:PTS galactosamine transporter subunit IID [Clostridium beijerinckii]|uniref:PTS galactosamine transporter subunit IID n=1 Tax=Clostridium beijerinckii TaxID=1520 RepID=UPI00242AD7E5|nr:PTS galactosamine transporter subunit IID [Clostridium beijerinckii]MDG5856308.1 PTS galactosamine transporter subunit IID [Clostridium beijerinckii]
MKTESNNQLTKKDLRKLAFRSVLLQASFNYERMQAAGWTCALLPFLKKIHNNDKEKVSQSMKDNLEFINTNPTLVGFLMGLVLSLEENSEDRSLIKGLKVALFGPLAGIGDALLWFTLLPIVAGISASFASQGSIVGPILFFGVYVCVFLSRIIWTSAGYKLGVKAIDILKENSKSISKAATTLGVTVIGGLIASYVHITLLPSISISADHAISLQTDFVDKILPNILPMGYTLLMFYFLKKKNVNPTILILVTFALAILLSLVGVL